MLHEIASPGDILVVSVLAQRLSTDPSLAIRKALMTALASLMGHPDGLSLSLCACALISCARACARARAYTLARESSACRPDDVSVSLCACVLISCARARARAFTHLHAKFLRVVEKAKGLVVSLMCAEKYM